MALIIRCVFIWVALSLMATAVQADQVVELYRADALVKSQSQAQREAAAKHALERVLIRVSGNTAAAESPQARQALARAQDYVYEYSYASTDETLEGPDGEPIPASRLHLKFSPASIEQLLRATGLSFWPANRPTLLVWVVVNSADGLEVVRDEQVWQALRERAELRGLPLMAPLFDLEDHLAMPAESLWRMDESAIRNASERYRADAILTVRYSALSDGSLRGNWQLLHSEGDLGFDGAGATAEELLSGAIDSVADRFAGLYGISPSESGAASIAMLIDNVHSFGDYKKAERYLASLALVRRVQLHSIGANGLMLNLYTEGDVARLENTLALDRTLLPASESVSLSENRYQIRGSLLRPLRYRLEETQP